MLFHFICCLPCISASGFPEKVLITENGSVTEKVEGRIVGGLEVTEDEENFSFQVQIVTKYHDFCSGSIIDAYYIVTAAHCVYNVKVQDVEVRADSLIRGEGMLVPIASIVIPDEYDPLELDMDVAVMRTVNPLKFRVDFTPIHLVDAKSGLPDSVLVSGWGRTDEEDFALSDKLMFVNLPLVNNIYCQSRYPFNEEITKNMFCAGNSRRGSRGTCEGDGGGPATDGYYYNKLVGISIYNRGCGNYDIPSVFMNVLAKDIRNFINNNTKYQGNSFGSYQYGDNGSSASNHSAVNHDDGDGDHDDGKHDVCSRNQNGGDNDSDNYDSGNSNGNDGCNHDSGNHNSGNNAGCRQKGGGNTG